MHYSIKTEFKKGNIPCKKGIIPWNKGIPMKNETKIKISRKLQEFSKINTYRHSDETKKKMGMSIRKSMLKRFEKLGIAACEDKGAKEFFNKLNEKYNTNFIPKVFMEIGYVADGYDETRHIWMEYDTEYHNSPAQKKRDSIRQNNIINYFAEIKNPLNNFIRVKSIDDNIEKIQLENKNEIVRIK